MALIFVESSLSSVNEKSSFFGKGNWGFNLGHQIGEFWVWFFENFMKILGPKKV